jgi:hypothetical protein
MLVRRFVLIAAAASGGLTACGGGDGGPTSYTVAGSVNGLVGTGLTLRNSNGETLSIAANGTFAFATPIASGASYQVTVASQPDTDPKQICSVSNGSGRSSVNVSNVSVSCVGSFVYLISSNSNGPDTVVLGYTMNVASGALTAVPGAPPLTDIGPSQPVVDRSRHFLYTANNGAGDISAFSVDPATGALSALPGSPFPTGGNPSGMLIYPTANFAYLSAMSDNNIVAYSIDPATGALAALPGSPYATGAEPSAPLLHPSGRFLYTLNDESGAAGPRAFAIDDISGFTIDGTTGALTPIPGSPFALGWQSSSLTFDPTGRFAYAVAEANAAGYAGNYFYAFAVDSTTGALSPVPGSPFVISSEPIASFVIDPTGHFGYANVNGLSGYLVFSIDQSTGAPSPNGSITASGLSPVSPVTFVPQDQLAFGIIPGGDLDIEAYTASDTGTLTPVSGPYNCGQYLGGFTFDPSGRFFFALDSAGITVCPMNPQTGALSHGTLTDILPNYGVPFFVPQG